MLEVCLFNDNSIFELEIKFILGARGGSRRGGPPYEGTVRGGRSQRFNKFEGQGLPSTNEISSFEQSGDSQPGARGGGRGRGAPRRGNFEGSRGIGFRGRGGRGNFNIRNQDDNVQQDNSGWQQSAEYAKFYHFELVDESRLSPAFIYMKFDCL